MDSPTTPSILHQPSVASRKPPDSHSFVASPHTPSRSSNTPRLGDFTKLHESAVSPARYTSPSSRPPFTPSPASSPVHCEAHARLGNFSKIFNQLGTPESSSPVPSLSRGAAPSEQTRSLPPLLTSEDISKMSGLAYGAWHPCLADGISAEEISTYKPSLRSWRSPSPTDSDTDSESTTSSGSSSPGTTPPSSAERNTSVVELLKSCQLGSRDKLSQAYKSTAAVVAAAATTAGCAARRSKPTEEKKVVLTYQKVKNGPRTAVTDIVKTREAAHEALTKKLVDEHVKDRAISLSLPEVSANGIHVFLDMSNITISFLQTIRAKYRIAESDRFVPLPRINLEFLHALLLRGRTSRVLNVGCSMHPDRSEPDFVQTLRNMDYRVDLRYRKPHDEHHVVRKQQISSSGSGWSSDEARYTPATRYVEDMVDETLQTRIGESVMEYFQEPGTIVLVTGDARPAKFSDGFFTYAERALKMGWNVEVVSWKSSLSTTWRDPTWAKQWGARFRIIELDRYVDELFEAYA